MLKGVTPDRRWGVWGHGLGRVGGVAGDQGVR